MLNDLKGFLMPYYLPSEAHWGATSTLEIAYKSNDDKEIRITAGKALDYSSLRIWAHEHPIATTITGIVAVGAASGLGYMLVQYFSK